MRSRFQHGLDELKERLLEMGGMAEAAIELAADSYRKRDATTGATGLRARKDDQPERADHR